MEQANGAGYGEVLVQAGKTELRAAGKWEEVPYASNGARRIKLSEA